MTAKVQEQEMSCDESASLKYISLRRRNTVDVENCQWHPHQVTRCKANISIITFRNKISISYSSMNVRVML